jgi:hypothetical protein
MICHTVLKISINRRQQKIAVDILEFGCNFDGNFFSLNSSMAFFASQYLNKWRIYSTGIHLLIKARLNHMEESQETHHLIVASCLCML